jgi:ribosomal protein S12 methylthiotransferase accessory factor
VISPCLDPDFGFRAEAGGHMSMRVYSGGGKKVLVGYEGFTIETDQSVKNGGECSAPEPFDLFLAALGACAGHYVYSFCEKRDIPIDGITVMQSVDRDKQTKMIEKVRIEIALPGDFPQKYVSGVVRSAALCTVKKQLNPSIAFEITTRSVSG